MTQQHSQPKSRLFKTLFNLTHPTPPPPQKSHLLYVEDKKVFNSADGGQHWTVKGADPADRLTIDDLQHVLRDGKLLLSPPLGQPTVTVHHDQPGGWTTAQGDRLQEQRRRLDQRTARTSNTRVSVPHKTSK